MLIKLPNNWQEIDEKLVKISPFGKTCKLTKKERIFIQVIIFIKEKSIN
jgi:hypothetical protein